MADSFDLLLRGGTVANHDGVGVRDVGIKHGRIAAIGVVDSDAAAKTIDCRGLHVLPGLIDSQVHFREPGPTHKEDLATGSRAAVLGGITAVFEMPNTNPLTTTAAAIDDKLARAHGRMWCDHAFYVGGTHDNYAQLPELERLPGVCGVKVFMGASTGDLLVPDDAGLARILAHGVRRVAVHSEDEDMLRANKPLARIGDWTSHPEVRSAAAALQSTRRLLALARAAGRRIHVLHISTADELPLLAANKDIATAEILPQHLTLTAPDAYLHLKGRAQMNPPIRDAAHQGALWAAVREGLFDVMGSDHAPHTLEEKAQAYPASPSGMPGVQTMVAVMLTHVAEGRLSLLRLIDLLAHGPQRTFGMAGKGRLAIGYDADITVVDLGARREIRDADMATRSGWTPFDGMIAKGWPVGTIIRGARIMWDGEVLGTPAGQPVRFQETVAPRA